MPGKSKDDKKWKIQNPPECKITSIVYTYTTNGKINQTTKMLLALTLWRYPSSEKRIWSFFHYVWCLTFSSKFLGIIYFELLAEQNFECSYHSIK